MSTEAPLPEQFTSFNPETLALWETMALFEDKAGHHDRAFHFQLAVLAHQFGLSQEAARSVVSCLRPRVNQPPDNAGLPLYFRRLSQETGLGFRVDQALLEDSTLSVNRLGKILASVYGVDNEKIYQAADAMATALLWGEDNQPRAIIREKVELNLVRHYTLLKEAIS